MPTPALHLLVSLLTSAAPVDYVASTETDAATAVASEQGPQDPQLGWGFNQGASKPSPAGGTPEPGTLLLLSGGGLAYGALRRRKKAGRVEE